MKKEIDECISQLVSKSRNSVDAGEAMKFSQSALNLIQCKSVLQQMEIRKDRKPLGSGV